MIVGHSLLQRAGVFPYLAPSHYMYLATNDLERASAGVSITDLYDLHKRELLEKVRILSFFLILRSNNSVPLHTPTIQDKSELVRIVLLFKDPQKI